MSALKIHFPLMWTETLKDEYEKIINLFRANEPCSNGLSPLSVGGVHHDHHVTV